MTEPEKEQKPTPYFYANVARVLCSPYEFLIDFGVTSPETPDKAMMGVRVAMSPQHAKALLKAMGENIVKYEDKYGRVSFPPAVDDVGKLLGQFGLKPEIMNCPHCGKKLM